MPSRTFAAQAGDSHPRFSCAPFLLWSLVSVAAASLLPATAFAASPDAWSEFRKAVETSCRAAAAPLVTAPQIVVDPFGSESYGLAFLNGVAVEGGMTRSLVCIYDKAEKTAEIGGSMALEQAVPTLRPAAALGSPARPSSSEAPPSDVKGASQSPETPAKEPVRAAATDSAPSEAGAGRGAGASPIPVRNQSAAVALSERFLSPSAAPAVDARAPSASGQPSPLASALGEVRTAGLPGAPGGFSGQCDAACAVTLGALGAPDREALLGLAAEVKRTVDQSAAASLAAAPAKTRDVALAIAASVDGEPLGAVSVPTKALAGERSCVLYYYGYSGEAARTVGRHRCAVSEGERGALVVEKRSGERLRAEVRPLTAEVAAFVGRSYEPGQAETAYDPAKPLNAANPELGNTVGFAAASEEGIVLVSSQRRRFTDEGDFFWVLAVDPK